MFNFIIPVCNTNGDDFSYRVNNVNSIINSLPNNVKLILVEQDMGHKLFGPNLNLRSDDKHIIVKYKIFNKPWLQNIGVRESDSQHVIIGESDCIPDSTGNYFIELDKHIQNRPWCHAWNRIQYHGEDYNIITRDEIGPKKGLAEGGLVYFNKSFYNSIGGANEWFLELGGMDNELIRRAEFKCINKPFKWIIHHHWHPSNIMKADKWANSLYRKDNQAKYRFISVNVGKVIDKLNRLEFGNKSYPLCHKMKWEDVINSR